MPESLGQSFSWLYGDLRARFLRRFPEMKVVLVDYDPRWPKLLDELARDIRKALGRDALLIEHVGSTAVEGLPAKPVIDLVLVVPDSADEDSFVPQWREIGYQLHIREPDWHEHRLLKPSTLDVNLHVFSEGSSEIGRMLDFRNRLRSQPKAREQYLQKKKELAEQEWSRVQDYADAKGDVVEAILGQE